MTSITTDFQFAGGIAHVLYNAVFDDEGVYVGKVVSVDPVVIDMVPDYEFPELIKAMCKKITKSLKYV